MTESSADEIEGTLAAAAKAPWQKSGRTNSAASYEPNKLFDLTNSDEELEHFEFASSDVDVEPTVSSLDSNKRPLEVTQELTNPIVDGDDSLETKSASNDNQKRSKTAHPSIPEASDNDNGTPEAPVKLTASDSESSARETCIAEDLRQGKHARINADANMHDSEPHGEPAETAARLAKASDADNLGTRTGNRDEQNYATTIKKLAATQLEKQMDVPFGGKSTSDSILMSADDAKRSMHAADTLYATDKDSKMSLLEAMLTRVQNEKHVMETSLTFIKKRHAKKESSWARTLSAKNAELEELRQSYDTEFANNMSLMSQLPRGDATVASLHASPGMNLFANVVVTPPFQGHNNVTLSIDHLAKLNRESINSAEELMQAKHESKALAEDLAAVHRILDAKRIAFDRLQMKHQSLTASNMVTVREVDQTSDFERVIDNERMKSQKAIVAQPNLEGGESVSSLKAKHMVTGENGDLLETGRFEATANEHNCVSTELMQALTMLRAKEEECVALASTKQALSVALEKLRNVELLAAKELAESTSANECCVTKSAIDQAELANLDENEKLTDQLENHSEAISSDATLSHRSDTHRQEYEALVEENMRLENQLQMQNSQANFSSTTFEAKTKKLHERIANMKRELREQKAVRELATRTENRLVLENEKLRRATIDAKRQIHEERIASMTLKSENKALTLENKGFHRKLLAAESLNVGLQQQLELLEKASKHARTKASADALAQQMCKPVVTPQMKEEDKHKSELAKVSKALAAANKAKIEFKEKMDCVELENGRLKSRLLIADKSIVGLRAELVASNSEQAEVAQNGKAPCTPDDEMKRLNAQLNMMKRDAEAKVRLFAKVLSRKNDQIHELRQLVEREKADETRECKSRVVSRHEEPTNEFVELKDSASLHDPVGDSTMIKHCIGVIARRAYAAGVRFTSDVKVDYEICLAAFTQAIEELKRDHNIVSQHLLDELATCFSDRQIKCWAKVLNTMRQEGLYSGRLADDVESLAHVNGRDCKTRIRVQVMAILQACAKDEDTEDCGKPDEDDDDHNSKCIITYSSQAILLLALLLLPREISSFALTRRQKVSFVSTRQGHHHVHQRIPANNQLHQQTRRAFALCAKIPDSDNDQDFDDLLDDVPADWTEADIAAELGDIVDDLQSQNDDDVVIAEDEFESDKVDSDLIVNVDEDEVEDDEDDVLDDDDDELDDIVLELEDEDDDLDDIVDVDIAAGSLQETSDSESLVNVVDDDWEEEEAEDETIEILDDPDDPNYMKQKELVMADIEASIKRAQAEEFDAEEWVQNEMTDEQARQFDSLPIFQQVEEAARQMEFLTENDVKNINVEQESSEPYDIVVDEPFPRSQEGEFNLLRDTTGVSDNDMEELDAAFKDVNKIISEEPWDKIMQTANNFDWNRLDNQTITEIQEVLKAIKGSSYNVTTWLLYDLNFNVSNLMLAAVKHNRNAPILFRHWYPQLNIYERYKQARENNFDFTWEDVEAADISELERYYRGFGYTSIPDKAPAETGIISFEDLDEEEIKMAAFENWMKEVYNPEWDKKDFDDDALTDEDNVFSDYYVQPQHPDIPDIDDAIDDYDEWQYNMRKDGGEEWSNHEMIAQRTDYTYVKDEEFERDFRGHLIVACTGEEGDLNIAEKITERFQKEFGKQVFVETRLMALAREEDNVFEIWLESYEIDLLHSKKRATGLSDDWTGPAECDDQQIDWLVERVRFLISDDARYSYRMDLEHVDQ
ncbi:hypothetical protein MPSEU_000171400 [Mayamaea pseudoterrestris]|nr:hypothetical protein MPSEU_000171400 [Mayamaea pseudoterrestris]